MASTLIAFRLLRATLPSKSKPRPAGAQPGTVGTARRVAAIVHRVSLRGDAPHRPFYCQPDPAKEYFVQSKALALLGHRGGEYIVWKKRDGSLSATRVFSRFAGCS
jgi:hypothetical protein